MDAKKKFAGDFLLTFAGLIVFNAAIQLIVYPLLSKYLGNDQYGEVLYYISIFSITSVALGLSVGNTQLVQRNNYGIVNGDCMSYNLIVLAVMTVVCGGFLFIQKVAPLDIAMVVLIQALMAIRYYTEAIYKISMNFKRYLIFCIVLTSGYIVGIVIFRFVQQWWIPFVIGEFSGIIFSYAATNLKEKPFLSVRSLGKFAKNTTPLLISYLLYYLVMNLDRIIIRNVVGSDSVGPYYTATLIGKTAAMVVSPLSGVIIGYLTKNGSKLDKKQFSKFIGVAVAGGVLFFGLTLIGTPIFTKLFYPNYYQEVLDLMLLVNLGQVMCFVSELVLNVVLTFRDEKWQMIVQIIYAVIFIVIAVVLTKSVGVIGVAVATAVSNSLRLLLSIALGLTSKSEIKPV